MQRIFQLARHLAFIALVVRALLPAGWMPNSTAGTPLVICTLSGPVHVNLDANGKPAKQDNDRADPCPFGAAPHFATLDAPITAPTPAFDATSVALPTPSEQLYDRPSLSAHAPRAPPTLA